MSASPASVQSVDRVLDILEALSAAPFGLLLTELSTAVGLHISTTHRLVNALVERGYALKELSSGKYRLTLRTFAMGCRISAVWDLLSAARPYLDELAAMSQEAVHLVERDGNSVVYLYKAEPYHQLVRMGSYTGLRNPMYCTGVGKSILALLPQAEVTKILSSETLTAFSPNTIIDPDTMNRELALTRARGYALDNEEHEPGVSCVGVAIRNHTGEPIGAISISAPTSRLDNAAIHRFLPKLLETANIISRMLGYNG